MKHTSIQRDQIPLEGALERVHPRTGRIAASEKAGEILVECDGHGPVPARLLSGINRLELSSKNSVGREVLLVFDGGDPDRPIVVGVLENVLESLVSMGMESREQAACESSAMEERLVLEAADEMVLKCGEGSITIKKEGRIVIRGTDIVSRASGTNKIKGGSVELN